MQLQGQLPTLMGTVDLITIPITIATCLSFGPASRLRDRPIPLRNHRHLTSWEDRQRTNMKHHAGFPRVPTSLCLRFPTFSNAVIRNGARSIVLICPSVDSPEDLLILRPLSQCRAHIPHTRRYLSIPTLRMRLGPMEALPALAHPLIPLAPRCLIPVSLGHTTCTLPTRLLHPMV